ncbi:MAG: hypothetical protein LAT51_02025 [Flavobacteriaceae bacterium]|nr:hypothetical protein [Flavobacteriaceae bacterium]
MKNFLLIFCVFLVCSCAPSLKQFVIIEKEALPEEQNVAILTIYDSLPEGASKLGGFVYDEPNQKNINFENQLQTIEEKARSLGGNLVKIREISSNSGNTFQLKAEVYFYDHVDALTQKDFHFDATQNESTIFIYPQPSEHLHKDKYVIKVNGEEKDVLANDILQIKTSDETMRIELGEEELFLNIEKGFTYFVNVSKAKKSKPAKLSLIDPLKARLAMEAYFFDKSRENTYEFDNEILDEHSTSTTYPEIEHNKTRIIKQKSVFINTGLTNRLLGLPLHRFPERNSIQEDLENGYYASIGGSYFFAKSHGVGFTYDYYNNSVSTSIENNITTNGLVLKDHYTVNRNIHYFGVYYHKRFFVFNQDELVFSFGPGYFFYDALNKDNTQSSRVSSSDFATKFYASYDFHLKNNLFLRVDAGGFFGRTQNISSTYRDFELENVAKSRDERSQARLFIGIGLKYNF